MLKRGKVRVRIRWKIGKIREKEGLSESNNRTVRICRVERLKWEK